MTLNCDPDLAALVNYMQSNFAATKLLPLTEAVAKLAPAVWSQHGREELTPLMLAIVTPVETAPAAAKEYP